MGADAVTEMTNRFSAINTDEAGPLKASSSDVDGNVYSCKHCRTHLAVADDINTSSPRRQELPLQARPGRLTSSIYKGCIYSAADLLVFAAERMLDGKMGVAYDGSQKYKEGKFVLER